MEEPNLERLAAMAVLGDAAALEELCLALAPVVYNLSLRMLGHPTDAEDATQEILVQTVTHLAQFEGRSKLTTWVYAIATRHLLRSRRRTAEEGFRGPEFFADWLDEHRAPAAFDPVDRAEGLMLEEECRVGCTMGMLMCLSRDQRAALLLGDVLRVPDTVGAEACGITRAAFRQRLARARRVIRTVIAGRCGLVDASNPCRCDRLIGPCIDHGFLQREHPVFARLPRVNGRLRLDQPLERAAEQLDEVVRWADVVTTDSYQAPEHLWERLKATCADLLA